MDLYWWIMDGWITELMDGWIDGWMDGWMDVWMDELIQEQMTGCKDGGWIDRYICVDGWMDR